jgi:hypothetical protein
MNIYRILARLGLQVNHHGGHGGTQIYNRTQSIFVSWGSSIYVLHFQIGRVSVAVDPKR